MLLCGDNQKRKQVTASRVESHWIKLLTFSTDGLRVQHHIKSWSTFYTEIKLKFKFKLQYKNLNVTKTFDGCNLDVRVKVKSFIQVFGEKKFV